MRGGGRGRQIMMISLVMINVNNCMVGPVMMIVKLRDQGVRSVNDENQDDQRWKKRNK